MLDDVFRQDLSILTFYFNLEYVFVLPMCKSSLLEVQEEEKVRQDEEGENHGILHRFETVVKDHKSRQGLKEVA